MLTTSLFRTLWLTGSTEMRVKGRPTSGRTARQAKAGRPCDVKVLRRSGRVLRERRRLGLAFVTNNGCHVVMKKVGIADLKAHLSGHLRAVKKGETLIVVERGTPVARVVPAADLRGGIVTRPPSRDLSAAKRMLKALPSLALPIGGLAILLEDRRR